MQLMDGRPRLSAHRWRLVSCEAAQRAHRVVLLKAARRSRQHGGMAIDRRVLSAMGTAFYNHQEIRVKFV